MNKKICALPQRLICLNLCLNLALRVHPPLSYLCTLGGWGAWCPAGCQREKESHRHPPHCPTSLSRPTAGSHSLPPLHSYPKKREQDPDLLIYKPNSYVNNMWSLCACVHCDDLLQLSPLMQQWSPQKWPGLSDPCRTVCPFPHHADSGPTADT